MAFEAALHESAFATAMPKAPDSLFFFIVIHWDTVYNRIER